MSATEKKNEVAVAQRKGGLTAALAAKFDMEPGMFLDTIKKTVMPSSASNEEVAAFLMVAKEYDMNPLLKEIHAFPKKGGGIQPVVGVDGWAKIITRHHDFDGVEFMYGDERNGKPTSVTCILYRKSCGHPVTVTEYYSECHRNTEPWNSMPRRMLRHKALMQCGRIAFGLSVITDEDEARDFCEVDATVVSTDPLSPGRHERKPTRTRNAAAEPELTPMPAPEIQPEEQTDEESEEPPFEPDPAACKDHVKLVEVYTRSPDLVKKAIELAAKGHVECERLREFSDIDHTDPMQCALVMAALDRVKRGSSK